MSLRAAMSPSRQQSVRDANAAQHQQARTAASPSCQQSVCSTDAAQHQLHENRHQYVFIIAIINCT